MSSGLKCKNCGSADIEVDTARGDAVCTNCGSVLEDNIIVSEVQFEEAAHGTSNAVGQFVSADSKGGATGYGKFHVGIGIESREVTLRKARVGITHLSQQLRLNTLCIDRAFSFFKMALTIHLTRGRRNTHVYAACVYITCRTEGTSHLLIDISDILQICCYELGRTYLKLTQSLCINLPSIDPCLYIMRFANKLEFHEKTHEVSMTAQRLVQRMMKDSIHSGRRPSGLCGAALLIAARMHDFNRTPMDIVRIVKIHESTLRKRLVEFGETPSSGLTLDQFMTIDLEAEQDPPAFKAARKRDKERLARLADHQAEFSDLQREIDMHLEKDLRSRGKRNFVKSITLDDINDDLEHKETDVFIRDATVDVIKECLVNDVTSKNNDSDKNSNQMKDVVDGNNNNNDEDVDDVKDHDDDEHDDDDDEDDPKTVGKTNGKQIKSKENRNQITKSIDKIGIGPDIAAMCIPEITKQSLTTDDTTGIDGGVQKTETPNNDELDLCGLDDGELDSYIMTEQEAKHKDRMWNALNAEYLRETREKEERLAKEREEGKPEKKKRRTIKKKFIGPSNTPSEAIEKMLQEKRISNKINYDILKTLTKQDNDNEDDDDDEVDIDEDGDVDQSDVNNPNNENRTTEPKISRKYNSKDNKSVDDKITNFLIGMTASSLSASTTATALTGIPSKLSNYPPESPPAGRNKTAPKLNTTPSRKKPKPIVGLLPIVEPIANVPIVDADASAIEENDDDDYDDDKLLENEKIETEKTLAEILNAQQDDDEEYYGYEEY